MLHQEPERDHQISIKDFGPRSINGTDYIFFDIVVDSGTPREWLATILKSEASDSVTVVGSFTEEQKKLLLSIANEVVADFEKQYEEWKSEEDSKE